MPIFVPTERDGVAYLDVADGADINAALSFLEKHVAASATVTSGIVNVTASTQFTESLIGRNEVVLNINAGVTLTLAADLVDKPAYSLSNTVNSGITGAGTLDVNGNAPYGVFGAAAQNVSIGNVHGTGANPDMLTIVGWKHGVAIVSTATKAAENVVIKNLELIDPDDNDVQFPVLISNRPTLNGQWVQNVTIDGLLVDGGELGPGGVRTGGEWSDTNQFTADQVTLQGVHGGTVSNVTSLNGGENGITISWGSRDITVTDSIAAGADGHGFNIGGGAHGIDVASSVGFRVGMEVVGSVSGAIGYVSGVFAGRLWLRDIAGNRLQTGETLNATGAGQVPSTTITATYRTENITLERVLGERNGLGVGDDHDPRTGDPVAFADFYIQQADNIFVSGTASSVGRLHQHAPGLLERVDHFGIYVGSGSYQLGDMTYLDYGNGQIPVGAFGGSQRLPILPTSDSIIHSVDGNSRIVATAAADMIFGHAGNDYLDGREGNDEIQAGSGDDTVLGFSGRDTLFGGAGLDRLNGGEDADVLYGQGDDDTLYGGGGDDRLWGSIGNDYLSGNDGVDLLDGGDGDDVMLGGEGNDTLAAGAGADRVNGNGGDDKITGADGDDHLSGDGDDDLLLGGAGADTLLGGSGNDRLEGESENDTINGDSGNDILLGGLGIDRLSGGDDDDRLEGGAANDILNGDGGDDVLFGDDGDDEMQGGGGDDEMSGGTGFDNLIGGVGNDRLSGGEQDDTLDGQDGVDNLQGGAGNDTLLGGNQNDALYGQDGDDDMFGHEGADVAFGGIGSDDIAGGGGNDLLNGNGGIDFVDGGDGDDRIFGGGDNDDLNGGLDNDSLYGQHGNDILQTSFGDDYANGGGDDDTLYGSDGRDSLYGGAGNDGLLGGNGDDLLHGGTGDDQLEGNGENDTLIGYHGNDVLIGGGGNDSLRGGDDDDTLRGQAGDDRFVFDNDWGHDTIGDFANNGIEKIDFRPVDGIDGLADLVIANVAGGVRISFGDDWILMSGRTAAQIDASDFLF